MFVSADTMALLMEMGVTGDKLVELFRALERDAASVAPVKDDAAERRRAADRERKRQERAERNVCGMSADASADEPLSPSPSPQTPQPRPHTRGDIYTPAREAGPSKADIAKGFLAFWAAYPKHVGKDAAAKAFERAVRRIPDPDPLAVILAGIERALPGWDDRTFIPHPATWLNQGRWDDDAPEPRSLTPTSPRNANRPDRHAARLENYDAHWAGADGADQVLAARRAL